MPKKTKTPEAGSDAVEIVKLEPVVVEVEKFGKTFSHLILFEIKARLSPSDGGLAMDGDIKQTIYQMREF
jgi:hypothetical protein